MAEIGGIGQRRIAENQRAAERLDAERRFPTLEGSFSAASKPNFASKYAFESSRRDLHNALFCTAL